MRLYRTAPAAFLLAVSLTPCSARAQVPDSTTFNDAAVEWVGFLRDQHFDSAAAHVDPAVAAQLGADRLEEVWAQIGAQLGALQSLDPGPVIETQGYHSVDLVGTFTNGVVTVRVTLTSDLGVAGLHLLPRGQGGSSVHADRRRSEP